MEEKIYNPSQLYFSVIDVLNEDLDPLVVFITPIEYFSECNLLSDSFGSDNIDVEHLRNAGLSEGELLESVFEIADASLTKQEVHQNMLNAGFIFNKEFDEFCNQ